MRNMKKKVSLQQGGRDRLGAQLTPQMYIMENFQLSFSPEQRRELNENGKFLHFAIFSLFSVPPTPSHPWIEYIRWFHKSFKIGSEDEWKFSLSCCHWVCVNIFAHSYNTHPIFVLSYHSFFLPLVLIFPQLFFLNRGAPSARSTVDAHDVGAHRGEKKNVSLLFMLQRRKQQQANLRENWTTSSSLCT